MKTEKEIDTVKRIYDTADILCELFKKYQNYDSEEKNIYDINEVFANRNEKKTIESKDMIVYKESKISQIIQKIKQFLHIK